VKQGSGQVQTGGGSAGGQSQAVSQDAPTTQSSEATSTSTQVAPTNSNVSVSIDPGAADPSGTSARGTLIQIFIPDDSSVSSTPTQAATAPASQTNPSIAAAKADNSNQVTQVASQQQSAEPGTAATSGGGSQSGGSGQTQVVEQSAPTTQTATADAGSTPADP